jgi:hypothetical protein
MNISTHTHDNTARVADYTGWLTRLVNAAIVGPNKVTLPFIFIAIYHELTWHQWTVYKAGY